MSNSLSEAELGLEPRFFFYTYVCTGQIITSLGAEEKSILRKKRENKTSAGI
jgi:hypothetical protein